MFLKEKRYEREKNDTRSLWYIKDVMKKASKHSLYSFVSFIENVAPDLPFINDLKSPPYYYFAKKDGGGSGRDGKTGSTGSKRAGNPVAL